MEKHRKLNKLKIGILIFLIIFAISIAVFGRYIYNSIREAYFTAQQFYFTSNILTVNGSNYQYNNWGGVDVYEIEFDLYSYDNKLSRLDYDLAYTVTCESLSTSKITCSIGTADGGTSQDGIIYKSQDNTSKVKILVTPIADINRGETVKLKVTAKTEVPYIKEISCEFSLHIELQGEDTYEIEDVVNRDYAVLRLVNAKETGTQVELVFDPSELRLDLNDEAYINRKVDETLTDSNGYVTKLVFDMAAESAKYIKFYKVDKTQDYTYPGDEEECVIDVTI